MLTEEITIRIDAEAAAGYRSATDAERRRLDFLLGLRLRRELKPRRVNNLLELMDEMSRKAQERGLTPEILQEILDEK